jgi:hypothetical protein
MKKAEQQAINKEIMEAIEAFNACKDDVIRVKRLRSCTAFVFKKGKYYVLQSYVTIVAFIDTETDTIYDILRYMYGYTSTSAQHISKFEKDYGAGQWGCARKLRFYNVED